ncbi:hypothetical protein [Planktothrix sp.]|uniref:hypothetical protein n=1 Tax=Planktothrix sp. TaxID=3088171 RepID=UPI0038D3A2C2
MFKRRYLVIGMLPDGQVLRAGLFSHHLIADKAAQLMFKWYPRLQLAQVVEDVPKPLKGN